MKIGDRVRVSDCGEGTIIEPDEELIKKIEELRPQVKGRLRGFYVVRFDDASKGPLAGCGIYPLTTYKLYKLPIKR